MVATDGQSRDGSKKIKTERKRVDQLSLSFFIYYSTYFGSIIYGTDESELILQPHFYFRY
ncbi:hypothetical protein EWU49_06645 [Enterococcus faecium]|nr:hypothetical protein EWU49_06645 [Enterococcus faecium]TAP94640.1 hypothetical protein EWU50_06435 [Enterococcus faecium]TAQ59348.1 hypothetical protein EWU59_06185 [Enterococcus faecium]